MDTRETKISMVKEFYHQLINEKNFTAAEKYINQCYIQHNPLVADGPEGLRAFAEFLKTNHPQAHSEIIRAFSDGDYVILHVHSLREPGTRGRAIIEIFRLENGKISEHWDTIQEIPEKSANPNTMF